MKKQAIIFYIAWLLLASVVGYLAYFIFYSQSGLFGATIITTNSGDTIGTFRTNVNTSLTNLNTALVALPTSSVVTIAGISTSSIGITAGTNITISTSTSAITINATAVGSVSTSSAITASYIPFWFSTAGALSGTSTLFASGTRIGLGTISPSTTLDIIGDLRTSATTTVQGKLVDAAGNAYVTSSAAASYPIEWTIEFPALNESEAIHIFKATSTITNCYAVNKTQGDTVTFNLGYGSNRSTATSTLNKLFTSSQTVTATTTPATLTVNGSSTPGAVNSLIFFTPTTPSSTEFHISCYFTTP